MGVAVQSHWLAVGAIVPWAAAGTGVLATQANSDLTAGRRGLELLASSGSAAATLTSLLRDDPRAAVSQIAVLDAAGEVAVHTAGRCVAEAGHRSGAAAALAPGSEELEFWRAIALASAGQRTKARQILSPLLRASPGWRSMLQRLPAAGLLPGDPGLLGDLLRDSPDVPQEGH